MQEKNYLEIPQDKFEFANTTDTPLTDKKLVTKSMSYFADAFSRFSKNKASVIATIIIFLIVVYAIAIPLIFNGPQTEIMDSYYSKKPARIVAFKDLGFDGGTVADYNERAMILEYAKAAGAHSNETVVSFADVLNSEYLPVIKVNGINRVAQGNKVNLLYNARVDQYLSVGFIYTAVTQQELDAIREWETKTGKQILYPLVEENEFCYDKADANYWYKTTGKAVPVTVDKDGKVSTITYNDITDITLEDNYLRDENGNLVYTKFAGSATSVQYRVRLLYFNYYQFKYNAMPEYLLGTDAQGYDLAVRMAEGIQLSLLLAVCVSAINFIIGAIYGAIAGYYGGTVDLVMERITDILSGIPFIIVATLFQIYFTNTGKIGTVGSLIFAFVLTGWIGTASRVRTQFYRFKNQEYIMAARTLGARDARIIWKHIFPNTLGTIITSSVLVIPGVIFSESMLSFLGIVSLGSSEGTSLGTLLSDASSIWTSYPHLLWTPAVILSLLMICFNLFGNGLRDAFNPSLRGVE